MATAPESDNDIRLILIGHTGAGKSSTGNSILGKNLFKVSCRHQGQTERSEWHVESRFGRRIEVIDTPGLFDPRFKEQYIFHEIAKATCLAVPGLTAFGLIMSSSDRYTREIKDTVKIFFDWFGEDLGKYAFIIMTDLESKEELADYMRNDVGVTDGVETDFSQLLRKFSKRILPIDNKGELSVKEEQVKAIIKQVDDLPRDQIYLNDCKSKLMAKIMEELGAENSLSLDEMKEGIQNKPSLWKKVLDAIIKYGPAILNMALTFITGIINACNK